ncbi:MAG TPA: hypothetical protein DC049_11900 [Spirochaetia bacterium]|nr:hypothetical protein [Spirochaetia bacterium]
MKLFIIWAVCCALARPQTLELFLSAKKQSPDQDKLSRMKIALHTNNLPAAEDLFCFYYINGLTANSNYHEARREARSFHKNFPESPFLNQVLRLENIIEYYSLESGIFFKRLTNLSDLSFFYKYFKEKNIRYVLVYEGLDNEAYLRNFEINTTMYNFIKDHKYFTTEIFPDENNLWRLYKLRDKI